MTPATLSPARAGAARPASRMEGALQSRAAYELAGCVGLILHLSLALPIYSWTDRIAGWLLLAFLLMALRDYMRQQVKCLPVFMLVAAQIYLFYGTPQFSQEALWLMSGYYRPPADALSWAVWLAVLGEAAFLAGYALTLRWMSGGNFFDRILPKPGPAWSTAVLVYLVPSLILYGLITLRPDYIPITIRMAVFQFFNVYLALAVLLYLGHLHKDRRSLVAAWGMIAVMALIGFIQGSMGNIVFPVFMGFLAAWLWTRTIRIRWMILIVVATVIINPAKNRFRPRAWGVWGVKDVSSMASVASRLDDWGQSFGDVWSGHYSARENLMETASRSSDLISFAQAIHYVPRHIPYNRGDGMGISLFYWVPRIFWPSKLESTDLLYNRYAIEFGYTTLEGTRTSTTGASVFIEGFWNFGVAGVLFFMGGEGILLAVLLGHNGRRGDASILASMAYLGGTMLLVQPLALAIPAAVTFSAGVFVAMWCIERIAVLPH